MSDLARAMAVTALTWLLFAAPPLPAATVEYDLTVARQAVNVTGRPASGMTLNGVSPGPTLRFREGDFARIRVHNRMDEETSIHWHGILVPPGMDGVPYLNFPPIGPGETFTYEFPIRQSGTYWYHSHTHLQEQSGVYGAIVIAPLRGGGADREQVVVLSDWTDADPHSVNRMLRRGSHWFAFEKGSAQSIVGAARLGMLGDYFLRELQRMPAMDISDVAYDRFLVNGRPEAALPAGPGERVLLRVINSASSTYFHLEFAGGPLTIVAADGQEVAPVPERRLLIGVAETYDLLVTLPAAGAHEFRATAHDGSGHASLWIGAGERRPAPDVPRPNLYQVMGHLGLRQIFSLTPAGSMGMPDRDVDAGRFDLPGMAAMGMDHGGHTAPVPAPASAAKPADHGGHPAPAAAAPAGAGDHDAHARPVPTTHAGMDHGGHALPAATPGPGETDHGAHGPAAASAPPPDRAADHGGHAVGSPDPTPGAGGPGGQGPALSAPAREAVGQVRPLPPMGPEGRFPGRRYGRDFGFLAADVSSSGNLAPDGTIARPWPPYARLRSLTPTAFPADKPRREIRLTLDGDMERFIWSFNNRTLDESEAIRIRQGEVVRFILINRTMMHHPIHLHGHFFRVLNGQEDHAPLKHTVDVAPMSTTVIEFAADEVGDWFFHCHLLYHMQNGMARVIEYEGFDAGPQLAALRPGLSHESWYAWGQADILSNMTEGFLRLADTRNIFTAGWEWGWQGVEKGEWETLFTWDRDITGFFKLLAGVDLTGTRRDLEENRAVLGIRYLLPLNLESRAWVDSDGGARIHLEKSLDLTPRLALRGEVEYDTRHRWEGGAAMTYLLSRDLSLVGRWHSEFGFGGGLQLRF